MGLSRWAFEPRVPGPSDTSLYIPCRRPRSDADKSLLQPAQLCRASIGSCERRRKRRLDWVGRSTTGCRPSGVGQVCPLWRAGCGYRFPQLGQQRATRRAHPLRGGTRTFGYHHPQSMRRCTSRVVLLFDADRTGWRGRATCSRGGVDPELFFPVGSGGPALLQTAAAKAVCRRCPVSTPCLMTALVRDEDGVWGGLSRDERRAIRLRGAA